MTTEAVIEEYSKRLTSRSKSPYNLFQLKQELMKMGYPLKKVRVIMRRIISIKRQRIRRRINLVFAGNFLTLIGAVMIGFPKSSVLDYVAWGTLIFGVVISIFAIISFNRTVNKHIFRENIYEF